MVKGDYDVGRGFDLGGGHIMQYTYDAFIEVQTWNLYNFVN